MGNFAGFTYPKYCVMVARYPLAKRLQEYKAGKREAVSPYFQNNPAPNNDGRGFYLESDFMPGLRWKWCDQISTHINHTGWFCDEYGDGDKIRGIVFRLPNNRGYLAGWSMGEGMCGEVEYSIYSDELNAAYAADRLAERVAEQEREAEQEESDNG